MASQILEPPHAHSSSPFHRERPLAEVGEIWAEERGEARRKVIRCECGWVYNGVSSGAFFDGADLAHL